jgi:nucleoid-associated protein YgaU
MVAKLLKSSVETIDMLNLDLIDNGLSLDLVNHTSSGLLILNGRTLPNHEIKFLNLKNIVGKSISNEFGKWKFKILKSELINRNITILTKIKGEEISLPLSQVALNEFIDSDYENLETKKIIVQPGNSLWRIARKNLGGGIFYSEIYKNNLKRIKNPDLIYPGQVFNIPDTKRKMLYE